MFSLSCEATLIRVSFLRKHTKKKGSAKWKVKSSRERWDHSWCQLFCFNPTLLGLLFVGKEKNTYSFGSHYTDSSKRNQFFHPWIKFLVSMIAVYPRRSQTLNITACSVISSDVSRSQCFQVCCEVFTRSYFKLRLKDQFISAAFFLTFFSTSILLLWVRRWSAERQQWNWWSRITPDDDSCDRHIWYL